MLHKIYTHSNVNSAYTYNILIMFFVSFILYKKEMQMPKWNLSIADTIGSL